VKEFRIRANGGTGKYEYWVQIDKSTRIAGPTTARSITHEIRSSSDINGRFYVHSGTQSKWIGFSLQYCLI
jgi:hypothetical protein